MESRRSRTSFTDDDSEIGLSGIPLSAITRNMFDFSAQRRPSISRMNSPLFVLVVFSACCIVFALVTGTSIEQEKIVTMEAGETRLISNYSPLLASKITISHHAPSVKVFHIKSSVLPRLQLDPTPYKQIKHAAVPAANSLSQSHFLNIYSDIFANFSSANGVRFYIFEGTTNYKNWLDDIAPGTWSIQSYSQYNSISSIHIRIRHSNVYYLVFKNEHEDYDSDLSYNITLWRTEYILDKKTPLCEVSKAKVNLTIIMCKNV